MGELRHLMENSIIFISFESFPDIISSITTCRGGISWTLFGTDAVIYLGLGYITTITLLTIVKLDFSKILKN